MQQAFEGVRHASKAVRQIQNARGCIPKGVRQASEGMRRAFKGVRQMQKGVRRTSKGVASHYHMRIKDFAGALCSIGRENVSESACLGATCIEVGLLDFGSSLASVLEILMICEG